MTSFALVCCTFKANCNSNVSVRNGLRKPKNIVCHIIYGFQTEKLYRYKCRKEFLSIYSLNFDRATEKISIQKCSKLKLVLVCVFFRLFLRYLLCAIAKWWKGTRRHHADCVHLSIFTLFLLFKCATNAPHTNKSKTEKSFFQLSFHSADTHNFSFGPLLNLLFLADFFFFARKH